MVQNQLKKIRKVSGYNPRYFRDGIILYLYYQEEKTEDQVRMEQQCIQLAEKEILSKIPDSVLRKPINIRLLGSQGSAHTTMQIWFGRYVLRIKTKYHKSNPGVSMEVWKKRDMG